MVLHKISPLFYLSLSLFARDISSNLSWILVAINLTKNDRCDPGTLLISLPGIKVSVMANIDKKKREEEILEVAPLGRLTISVTTILWKMHWT